VTTDIKQLFVLTIFTVGLSVEGVGGDEADLGAWLNF